MKYIFEDYKAFARWPKKIRSGDFYSQISIFSAFRVSSSSVLASKCLHTKILMELFSTTHLTDKLMGSTDEFHSVNKEKQTFLIEVDGFKKLMMAKINLGLHKVYDSVYSTIPYHVLHKRGLPNRTKCLSHKKMISNFEKLSSFTQ